LNLLTNIFYNEELEIPLENNEIRLFFEAQNNWFVCCSLNKKINFFLKGIGEEKAKEIIKIVNVFEVSHFFLL